MPLAFPIFPRSNRVIVGSFGEGHQASPCRRPLLVRERRGEERGQHRDDRIAMAIGTVRRSLSVFLWKKTATLKQR